ncbi:MAG: PPOX class F420-dependent oxidoreductase [Dehalococcoidia bacterium]
MLSDTVRAFVTENHMAVLTAHRKSGGLQMSVVTSGPYRDGVAFTTTEDRAKLINLRRDPRCALLVSKRDWWGYVVLDGKAEILAADNTDAEELRLALREVYRAAAGQEHPDWEEYDQAMRDERRAVVIVLPDQVYGAAA